MLPTSSPFALLPSTKPATPRHFVVFVALAALVLVGCPQEPEAPPEPEGMRVESPGLAIALADLPAFFQVVKNEGETLELAPADPQVAGTLVIGAETPEVGGVNLVAGIEAHQADIESRPDGVFKGQRELGSQLGTAFYSRGHFTGDDGTPQEETAVFVVHPDGQRMLTLTYTYPQGEDSADRLMEQLFVVLGELEPLDDGTGATAEGTTAEGAANEDAPSEETPTEAGEG